MAATTHIIYVHGRAPKPEPAVFGGLVRDAINRGLARRGTGGTPVPVLPEPFVAGPDEQPEPTAADPWGLIRNTAHGGAQKFTVAYYGDLTGALMVDDTIRAVGSASRIVSRKRAERNRALLRRVGDRWYDPDSHVAELAAGLDRLLAHPEPYTGAQHREMERRHTDYGWVEDALGAIEPLRGFGPMRSAVERVLKNRVPDLWGYLRTRTYGSPMRARLQRVLLAALLDGDRVVLVTHSLGCMVAYDVLWKLSWMSEFAPVRSSPGRVAAWVTLGSPLSSEFVKENLYDAGEPTEAKLPAMIDGPWRNIAAEDDPIAFDASAEDDFGAVEDRPTVSGGATDVIDSRVYNPFVATRRGGGSPVLDPHAELGYLAHPAVAEALAPFLVPFPAPFPA